MPALNPADSVDGNTPKPSGLEVDFDKNITKLYEAICNCDWDFAIATAKENPLEAQTWVVRHYEEDDDDGEKEVMWRFLPIHSACARQPPAAVISSLLKAYPDGARCVDDQGMYALHYACGNQASREVIRLLLVAHSQAAKIADPRGMLPIHYLACWGPSSVSIIDMVLVANRDVANAKDADGNTALDLAMEGEYPEREAVVAALRRWLEKSTPSSSPRTTTPVRGRGEDSSVISSSPSVQTTRSAIISSPLSSKENKDVIEDVSTTTKMVYDKEMSGGGTQSHLTVSRLRQEIAKLKADKKQRETEWEEEMKHNITAYKSQCDELTTRVEQLAVALQTSEGQVTDLENRLEENEHTLAATETELTEVTEQLQACELERDDLRQTLAEVTVDHDKHKRKAENMNDRLGSLSASLTAMMEAQEKIIKTLRDRGSNLAESSEKRREKLQKMIAFETEYIQSVAGNADQDAAVFEKQMKEMDAIAAVIAAVRQ